MDPALHHRRRSEVFRNLDDSLKVLGLLSMKSLGLLFTLYLLSFALDLTLSFWRLLFGRGAVLAEASLFACVALALACAERQDDEHLVPAMLRYWASRRSSLLYSGAAPDGWPAHRLDRVLPLHGAGAPAGSRR